MKSETGDAWGIEGGRLKISGRSGCRNQGRREGGGWGEELGPEGQQWLEGGG